jgi:hypothetical protein
VFALSLWRVIVVLGGATLIGSLLSPGTGRAVLGGLWGLCCGLFWWASSYRTGEGP